MLKFSVVSECGMQKAASQEHSSNLLALVPVLGPLAKSRADDESVSQVAGRLALNGMGAGVGKKVTQSLVHPLATAWNSKLLSRFGLGRLASLIGRTSSSFWGNVAGIPLGAVAGDMMADRAMDSIAARKALTKSSMVKAGMGMLPPVVDISPIGLPTIGDPKLVEETAKAMPEVAKTVAAAPFKAADKAVDKMLDKLNGGPTAKSVLNRAMNNLGRVGAGTGVGALIGAGLGGLTDKLTGGSTESALDAAQRTAEGGAVGGAIGSLVRPNGLSGLLVSKFDKLNRINKMSGGRLWRSSLGSSALLGTAAAGLYAMAHGIGDNHIPEQPVAQ